MATRRFRGGAGLPLAGGGGRSRAVQMQVATGEVNGINDEFTFTAPPKAVFYQGILQDLTTDYTLTGATVTFVVPPVSGTVKGLV